MGRSRESGKKNKKTSKRRNVKTFSRGPCITNLNSDGTVNTEDLLILNANWGPCGESAGGGGSLSLESAVQQMGFPSVAAHQAWLAQASDAEAYALTYVLITILQDQGQD